MERFAFDQQIARYVTGLITELCKLPSETGWLEFKENNSNPEDIGEYISALGNTAALQEKAILFDGYLMGSRFWVNG
jgi:hypothetical protein